MPMPNPVTMNGSTMLGHEPSMTMTRRVRKKPSAVTNMPANMSHFWPIRSESVPEVGAATMTMAASGVITRPALMAL